MKTQWFKRLISACLIVLPFSGVFADIGSFKVTILNEPDFENPVSQLATESQFYSPSFNRWTSELKDERVMNRKLWEFCYIAQVLNNAEMLQKGKKGLGFGVGLEPLPALFAKYGCFVSASDQDYASAINQGWRQQAIEKNKLNEKNICDQKKFEELVELRVVDMNNIHPGLFGEYDFVWSTCSLEHLGSLEAGLEFVKNSVKCLKPGGIAVHTTEFNLSSKNKTIRTGPIVIYRQKDWLQLALDLTLMGYEVSEINLHPGSSPLDQIVDLPPYKSEPHIRLMIYDYVSTSAGIIIRKPLD